MKQIKAAFNILILTLVFSFVFLYFLKPVSALETKWKLVETISDLSTNDVVVFVANGYGMGEKNGNYRNAYEVTMEANYVSFDANVTEFTVTQATSSTFTFKTGDYYLNFNKKNLQESATATKWNVTVSDSGYSVYYKYNGRTYYLYNTGAKFALSTSKKYILFYEMVLEEEPQTLPVESISLDSQNIELEAGQKETVGYNIFPSDATNQNVSWLSADTSVAKVDSDGTITAVSEGETTITATTEDGEKSDSVVVVVDAPFVPADQKTISDFVDTNISIKTHYDFNFGEYYVNGGTETKPTIDGMRFGTDNVTTGSNGVTFKGTSLIFFTIYSGSISNSEAFPYAIKSIKVYGINSNSMTVYGSASAAGSTTTISSSSSGTYSSSSVSNAKYYEYNFSSYNYKYFKVNSETFSKTGVYRIEVELKDAEIVETKNKIVDAITTLETSSSLNLSYLLYEDGSIEIDEVFLKYAVSCITKEEYENLTKLYGSVKVGFTYTVAGKEYTITDKDNAFSFDEKEINGKTFYLFVITFYDFPKDMNYFRTDITCQAFLELDGTRVNLISKTTSVYDLTRYYINNYNFAIEHTNEALKVLKNMCEN